MGTAEGSAVRKEPLPGFVCSQLPGWPPQASSLEQQPPAGSK